MAVTADQVEVRLRADTAQYVRNLNQADSTFTKVSNDIVANSARVNAATNNLSLNTGNIAAQFQDIGVTAAAGMNPLIIALQQGTQLSAVLNQSVSQGVSPVKALGAAFVQVLNPISLATIAAIALGATLLQSLGEVVPKSETATEALKRHREELGKIVRGYGDAEDAIEAYFDSVDRLPRAVADIKTTEQFKKLSEGVEQFNSTAERTIVQFDRMAVTGDATASTAARLTREYVAGELSAAEYYAEIYKLQQEMGAFNKAVSLLPGSIGNLINSMVDGAEKATIFGDAINSLIALSNARIGLAIDSDLQNALDIKTYIDEQKRLNGFTAEELALHKEIASIKADQPAISETAARDLALETLAAEKRRADLKKADTKGTRDYARERKEVTDLLEAMGLEAALLGQTNREKAIAIALSKANATATQEEIAAISQTAAFIYDTEQAVKKLNDTSQAWANTIQGATRGFIDDLIEGKSAAEAFSNVLSKVADQFLTLGLNNLFGTGGFNLAGLFGGTSTRATGGSVYAGNPTLVGEKGAEVFVPSGPGKIIPNSQIGGGGSVTFAPVIDARGADVAAVARLETVVQQLAANVVPTIRSEMATARKKGRNG